MPMKFVTLSEEGTQIIFRSHASFIRLLLGEVTASDGSNTLISYREQIAYIGLNGVTNVYNMFSLSHNRTMRVQKSFAKFCFSTNFWKF